MEIKQLTFTRFLAAFVIILFHYGQNATPFDSGLLGHFAREGSFAVSYFFCLSGYILTHVYYLDNQTSLNKKTFFIKRFARIYPIYLVGFLAALVMGIVLLNAIPRGSSILLQLFALHAWVPGIALEINYPSWSLSVELFFYLCFPFLITAFSKLSNKKIVLLTLILWLASAFIHIFLKLQPSTSKEWGEFFLFNPLLHLNTFIFGMVACIIFKRASSKLEISNFYSSSIFLVSCGVLFLILATDNFITPWVHNGLLAPLFIITIISLQLNTGFVARLFSYKLFIFLGEISFGMYILQHPVHLLFQRLTRSFALGASTDFYFFVILLISMSSITYVAIEKPARKWIASIKN